MPTQLEPIAALIKTARKSKGLSQRILGQRVGLPQSHISKIENAEVDLQTSSLIEIARALDLELTLLPRTALTAVNALQQSRANEPSRLPASHTLSLLRHQVRLLKPRFPKVAAFGRLAQTLDELRRLPPRALEAPNVRRVVDMAQSTLRQLRKQPLRSDLQPLLERLDRHERELRGVRNAITHGITDSATKPLPAYRLDDSSEGGADG